MPGMTSGRDGRVRPAWLPMGPERAAVGPDRAEAEAERTERVEIAPERADWGREGPDIGDIPFPDLANIDYSDFFVVVAM